MINSTAKKIFINNGEEVVDVLTINDLLYILNMIIIFFVLTIIKSLEG